MVDFLYFLLEHILLDVFLLSNFMIISHFWFTEILKVQGYIFLVHLVYVFFIGTICCQNQQKNSIVVNFQLYKLITVLIYYTFSTTRHVINYMNIFSFYSMISFNQNFKLIMATIFMTHGFLEISYYINLFLKMNHRASFDRMNYQITTFVRSPFLIYTSLLWLEKCITQRQNPYEFYSNMMGFVFCLSNCFYRQSSVTYGYLYD